MALRGTFLVGTATAVLAGSWSAPPLHATSPHGDSVQSSSQTIQAARERWRARYAGPMRLDDGANDVTVSPDTGHVFVTGEILGTDGLYDFATIAYDPVTGREHWSARYSGATTSDQAFALAVSPDGSRLFVTGLSTNFIFQSDSDFATVAYDAASGAQSWVATYDGPDEGNDGGQAIAVSPDGSRVYVTGFSVAGLDSDYATFAYDAGSGAQLWMDRYEGPGHGEDLPTALDVSPAGGGIFVTGHSWGGSSQDDWATLAYDAATGARLWETRYNGPGNGYDVGKDLASNSDGTRVFVTGSSFGGAVVDYATVAYDTISGGQLWVVGYDGPAHGSDVPVALESSPDGTRVYVTGDSQGAGSDFGDFATIAYDGLSGAQVWVARFAAPGNSWDEARALGVRPDGSRLYVTGVFDGPTQKDYATLAYGAADGTQLWFARFNGAGREDFPTALAVAPGGTRLLFVTGSSELSEGDTDYATVAYRG